MPNWKLFCLILLVGCSGLERSEREKIRRRNCVAERIYRNQSETTEAFFAPPQMTPREAYPWEVQSALPRVTKEFFRCKGTALNSVRMDYADPAHPASYVDCGGNSYHGLPIIHGKEGVYPVLLDILNYIQTKSGCRVVVTCGHRCPTHNIYADPSAENRTSKHQIGAEVDFYVQGMEEKPELVVELVRQYYRDMPSYQGSKEFVEFQRYDKADAQVATPPWMNKEIYLKICKASEGRDGDNQHPHPYLCIQVRYDRETQQRVFYNWGQAQRGYPQN